MLKEKEISLRTLESTDLDFLLDIENDRSLWNESRLDHYRIGGVRRVIGTVFFSRSGAS